MNTDTILITMVGIAGAAVLLQALVLLGMFIAMIKAIKAAKKEIDEFKTSVMPIIDTSKVLIHTSKELVQTSRDLIARLEPKLDAAASDLQEMVQKAREEAARLQESAEEINQRVRHQAARVDDMTTSVLNGVDRAGHFMNEVVSVPVRQVSGVIAAVKAVVDTLRAPLPPRPHEVRETRTVDEKDLFV